MIAVYFEHLLRNYLPYVAGILSILLAFIYSYKYSVLKKTWDHDRYIFLIRSLNWLTFGVAMFVFPSMPFAAGHLTLWIAILFMLLSQVAYNVPHFGSAIKDLTEWMHNLLR